MNANPAVAKSTVAPNQNFFCRISAPAAGFFQERLMDLFYNKRCERAFQLELKHVDAKTKPQQLRPRHRRPCVWR